MRKQGVDVVVVNYRTADDLQGFLDSYEDGGPWCPSTLWIVNVDPDPQSKRVADEYWEKHPRDVRLLSHDENIGYARSCNDAAARGQREVVAFFNADTLLDFGVVDKCVRALLSNEEWAVLGPRQVNEKNQITHAGIVGTNSKPQIRGWMQPNSNLYGGINTSCVSVMGSAYFVRRSVWNEMTACPIFRHAAPDATGAFLPTSHYWEETWLSYHVREHGYKVVYYGPATMIHKWHKASPRGGPADQQAPQSRAFFRSACDLHGIEHD